ncbi:ABC transporter permease [Thiomicrospira sp. WB1]|uniref:ABC transporter permease n=1 Tax=Thiomicrospira sp. WB1 TaxID=1685380 RepID=UPI000747FB91|nr:ABC transporter permease [Thiomicrospira sp. WB1]KUJ72022.1 peptide ABC transporter permease [Thiomicrospira sp. WB1]
MMAPLWSDYMIWLLVLSLLAWGRVLRRSPQVREQWLQIFQSKIAMIAAIVLLAYTAVALLDSVRFEADTQGHQTLLDVAFGATADQFERTYSAPFAQVEYNQSLVTLPNGDVVQQYQPLQWVQPETSILWASAQVLMVVALMTAFLVAGHLFWRARVHGLTLPTYARQVGLGMTRLPWRTAYLTLFGVLFTVGWLGYLSQFYHVLGTDKVGQDVLYTAVKSIRTGVLIGVLTTLVMLPLALFLGISAGLFKGWVDDAIQYLYTTLNSIPGVLLIAAAVLVMQTILNNNPQWFGSTEERADLRLLFLVFILGMTSWTGLCRLLRAETLKLSQVEFVTSARAFGVGRLTIIVRHIMPNVMHIVLIAVVLDFSGLVLAEAVLSYVGVGVDPTMHSWGNMINQARLEMAREPMVWWSLFSAFIFMFLLVLAANLFSDRVQRVLDPRTQTRQ